MRTIKLCGSFNGHKIWLVRTADEEPREAWYCGYVEIKLTDQIAWQDLDGQLDVNGDLVYDPLMAKLAEDPNNAYIRFDTCHLADVNNRDSFQFACHELIKLMYQIDNLNKREENRE